MSCYEPARPLDADADPGAALLAGPTIAKLAMRPRGRFGSIQAQAHELLRSHGEVELELLTDVAAHVLASAEREPEYARETSSSHCCLTPFRSP